MKTLILTRHAKSSWDDLTLQDHERILNKRGRAGAKAIGGWLADHNYAPDEVLCSTAERCRETYARIATHLTDAPEPVLRRRLYLAPPTVMYQSLKTAKGATVMMLGHNPGIGDFADALLGGPRPTHPKFLQYPSGATTVFQFDIADWSDPFMGKGRVLDFVVPKDLTE